MDKGEGHILLDLGLNNEDVYPLVGEIICDNVLNNEDVISNIQEAWKNKIYGKVHITNVKDNKYLFECDSDKTALEVIRGGPWIIMGHFLSLEYWESDYTLKEIQLTEVRIWVQVYGLKPGDLPDNGSMEEYIGDHIGVFIEADPKNQRHIVKFGFIRVKVFLNCYEVIKTGMFIYEGRRKKYRIDFKYENLAELCYNCGHLGHSTRLCGAELDHPPHPALGPWLRAKPIRFKKDEYLIEDCMEIIITTLVFIILGYFFCWKLFLFVQSL